MIKIIDENNIVTDEGVELVAAKAPDTCVLPCVKCYFRHRDDCKKAPCAEAQRSDKTGVFFMEKVHD